jgi:20S proteasome subunit alpha 3
VYNTWKAHAIGQNNSSAQSSLKQYYEENLTLNEGMRLTVKVLRKTLDKNKMSGENIEIFVLENVDGEIFQRFVKADEVNSHIEALVKEEAEEKAKSDKNRTEI